MSRVDQISGFHGYVSPLEGLRRHSRSVQVKVFEGGFEVDRFSLSKPSVLRAELRKIYRVSPKGRVLVELTGVEEKWFPMGLDRVHRETHLKNSADALFFLAA